MAEHKRKTKAERYGYSQYSYWGVSLEYWPSKEPNPHKTNLYMRIRGNHFDYNFFRAEIKSLLQTETFVLLNRWRAMSNEYRSFIQFHEREDQTSDPKLLTAPAGVDAGHWES